MKDDVESRKSIGIQNLSQYKSERSWKNYRWLLGDVIKYYESEAQIGTILDVGCGLGHFIECCLKFNIPCVGVEGAKDVAEKARSKGLNVICLDLEKERFPFDDNYFSAVVMNQFIEHLTRGGGGQE